MDEATETIPFTSSTDIKKWAEDKPHDALVVISARAALRAIPYCIEVNPQQALSRTRASVKTLSSFWATASTLCAGTWPHRAKYLAHTDVVNYTIEFVGDAIFAATATAAAVYDTAAYMAASYTDNDTVVVSSDTAYAVEASTDAIYDAGDGTSYDAAHAAYAADEIAINNGISANTLASTPLFPNKTIWPVDKTRWQDLKKALHDLGDDWEVWTDWYEGILSGGPRNPDIEFARIKLCHEHFEKYKTPDAAILNKEIKALYSKLISPQKLATVRTKWSENKLYLDNSPINPDLEQQIAIDNLVSLKEEFIELAKSVTHEANIDKRPANYIQRTANFIPSTLPSSKTIMRLIRREAVLLSFEHTVSEQWPDFLAVHYSALCTEFTNVLDQFPERRIFRRQQTDSELENFDTKEIENDIALINQAFRDDNGQQRIDESIPFEIEHIGDTEIMDAPIDAEHINDALIQVDQMESANNVMKTLAEGFLNDGTRRKILTQTEHLYTQGFVEGLEEGAKEAGKEDGKRIAKTLVRTSAAKEVAKASGSLLSDKYPKRFGWLKRLKL